MMTDDWSLGYTSVSGGEDICVGGQRLTVVFSPVFLISQISSFWKDYYAKGIVIILWNPT